MRLPIEDDWQPNLQKGELKEDGYEEHVRMLALRLKEAHKVAGQQSKISHQKAKRYYDEHTKLEHFSKGDLVYLYDPIYKRGKARKFAYKYKGPYEVKQKISPLVYKIQTSEGTDVIVHVNRLKRAQERSSQLQGKPSTTSDRVTTRLRKQRSPKQAMFAQIPEETEESTPTLNVPSKQIIEAQGQVLPGGSAQAELLHSSPEPDTVDDANWTPGSRYWQRKLNKDNVTPDLPYRLRSRTTCTRDSGAEVDTPNTPDVVTTAPAELSSDTSTEPTLTLLKHSYNLRSRTLSH